jgi:hypothetical protein
MPVTFTKDVKHEARGSVRQTHRQGETLLSALAKHLAKWESQAGEAMPVAKLDIVP